MKRLILIFLCSISVNAWAALPYGCYASNGSCYNGPFFIGDCDLVNAGFNGTYMANSCAYTRSVEDGLTACASQRDYNAAGWTQCNNNFNALAVITTSRDTLIKKLKKACGAKCKKIK